MRFNVGDIVRIAKDGRYYGINKSNPKDTNGYIKRIGGYMIRVCWDNDTENAYNEHDLKLVRRGND